MKIIASIVFSLVAAVFAVKANKIRFQEANDQFIIEQAKEEARRSMEQEIAEIHVTRLQGQMQNREDLIRLANTPAEQALAIEELRESRAELRRYQALAGKPTN
jgi:hypothetical protein